MALVFAALLTAGFAPLIAIPLDCMILGFPIELSSIGFTLSVDNTIWWWINVGPHCVPGCLASFALFLSVFVLMQLSASSKERAADGGVLGEARVKRGRRPSGARRFGTGTDSRKAEDSCTGLRRRCSAPSICSNRGGTCSSTAQRVPENQDRC